MKLTQKWVDAVKPTDKRETFRCDEQSGFGVRVESAAAGGRVSYFWNAKVNGKVHYKSLGERSTVSLKDARYDASLLASKARDWKQAGCVPADNPFIEKPDAVEHVAPTFRALVENYVREHLHSAKAKINFPDKAEKNIRYALGKYFQSWMDRPVDSFTQQDVIALRDSAGKHRYAANRSVQLAKILFAWCASDEDGRVPVWPIPVNPAAKLKLHEETKRERVLKPEELVRLEEGLDDERTPVDLADFVRLALATAARKDNLLGMQWTEIDWDTRQWHIPFSKSGRPYTVDLLPKALEILERRQKTRTTSPYVFPAVSAQRGYILMDKPFTRLVKRVGLKDLRIHDLRRTAATFEARAGVPLQKIAANLGHSPTNMESVLIYARLAQEDLPEARAAGADKMAELMAIARKRMKAQKDVAVMGGAR